MDEKPDIIVLKRLIVAAAGIPALLIAVAWPGGLPYAVVAALIGLIGVREMAAAVNDLRDEVTEAWPLLGVGVLILTGVHPAWAAYRWPALVFLFLFALTWETFSLRSQPFRRISHALLLTLYPALVTVSLSLRQRFGLLQLPSLPPLEAGAAWVGIALLLVWATDTGAYFAGRAWGRRKLAPLLSPSKTWEGAVGGWLCCMAAGAIIGGSLAETLFPGGALSGLALGAIAGAWAQVGDLVESAMKRELGVKDFGGWLPGHGGVLDRFDSFLFVCPLVYLWATFAA